MDLYKCFLANTALYSDSVLVMLVAAVSVGLELERN